MKKKYLVIIFCLISVGAVLFNKNTKISKTPNDYVSLANNMGIKGDHFGASKAFKIAIDIDPYYIPAYLGLGISYGNLGMNEDAIQVLKQGINLDKSYGFVPQMQMSIASIAYDKLYDTKLAVKYLKKALQNYTDQGNYAGVIMAAQKMKQFTPDSQQTITSGEN